MEITPLGAGCEVGRSCCIVRFRGSTVMFDCGLHPAYSGLAALPYFDEVDLSEIDLLLVTHFHMDHCGAVPYLTEKTNFKGRVFMTHPTKAIFKILQHDAVKVGHDEGRLFDEKDMLSSLDKVELIHYHQTIEHKGVKFTAYNAGHVLGACMFQIEVAGVRVLYTGDFSREQDRHLLGAEIPTEPPHVLISESTYGVSLHEAQAIREQRFTSAIHQIVRRGGRCLIPVFALGRSQELLLILDEYWKQHPELHDVPIYYASKVAKKSMRVYQTYINMMNSHIRNAHAAGTNPWEFTHVKDLDFGKGGSISNFDDSRPMVVMASPGMMQSGFSRELFEMWCSDKRNGLMMPGYSVAGTLAHHVMSEPKEITTSAGDKVPVNLSIHYISFSAHSDYAQTFKFIQQLSPAHVILVHGAEDVMATLQRELKRQFKGSQTDFLMPKNAQSVHLRFRGDKVARVLGSLAQKPPDHGVPLSGLLLKKDFKYTLMDATDLPNSTPLASIAVMQRPTFKYTGSLPELLKGIASLFAVAPCEPTSATAGESSAASLSVATTCWRIHEDILLTHTPPSSIVLEWPSGPLNDMIADAVAATLLQLQAKMGDNPPPAAKPEVPDEEAAAKRKAELVAIVEGERNTLAVRRKHVLRVLGMHYVDVKELSDAAAAVVAMKYRDGQTGGAAVKEEEGEEAAAAVKREEPSGEVERRKWFELTASGQRVLLEAIAGDEESKADEFPFSRLICDYDENVIRAEAARAASAENYTPPSEPPEIDPAMIRKLCDTARMDVARVMDFSHAAVAAVGAKEGNMAPDLTYVPLSGPVELEDPIPGVDMPPEGGYIVPGVNAPPAPEPPGWGE